MPELFTVEELLDLCAEVLPNATPTPDSNFFALGGDSLTATALAALAHERWGVTIEAEQIFIARDLTSLYRAIHA
ncbi:phosphopantetheine-binding protein [Streptomyces sp. NBC_00564]|uniref:phosphopantetheine-binding protein n=1 Tax=Streptomyces sp. NBC_00564 TaxID=2903663 RepID=UPI00352D14BD|nr:phosphopantetheine-binding protein [Streptomyces sp. NBC_00564]